METSLLDALAIPARSRRVFRRPELAAPAARLLGWMRAGSPERGGASNSERRLLTLFTFIRLAASVVAGILVTREHGSLDLTTPVVAFIAILFSETVVLLGVCWRTGAVAGRWAVADVSFCAGAMTVGVVVTSGMRLHSWDEVMSPFAFVTFAGLGLARARPVTIVAATLGLAATFLVTSRATHHLPYQTAAYFLLLTVVGRVVARNLRLFGQALNSSRLAELQRAGELAKERERVRHARLLHDRVLQTLEGLIRTSAVANQQLNAQVAEEVAWLRALLAGRDVTAAAGTDLAVRLHDIGARKRLSDLQVDIYDAGLCPGEELPADLVDTVAQATEEALTNVAKHAGVDRAVVRATRRDNQVVVTIVDHGRGFDPAATSHGLGVRESIKARLADAGGDAAIDSEPGEGTCVTLRVPAPPRGDRGHADARSSSHGA
jgi:signal transduction histidine kinase